MNIDWLIYIRAITLIANIAFMILLPFAIHIRVDWLGRTWLLIGAIEVAWLADCIAIIRRIIDQSSWDWFVSPFFMISGILGLMYVLRAGHQ